MSGEKNLSVSVSIQHPTPALVEPVEENMVQKLVEWKNIIYQNCAGKFVGGGIPYCLLGGTPCSFLHCPRNIYRFSGEGSKK